MQCSLTTGLEMEDVRSHASLALEFARNSCRPLSRMSAVKLGYLMLLKIGSAFCQGILTYRGLPTKRRRSHEIRLFLNAPSRDFVDTLLSLDGSLSRSLIVHLMPVVPHFGLLDRVGILLGIISGWLRVNLSRRQDGLAVGRQSHASHRVTSLDGVPLYDVLVPLMAFLLRQLDLLELQGLICISFGRHGLQVWSSPGLRDTTIFKFRTCDDPPIRSVYDQPLGTVRWTNLLRKAESKIMGTLLLILRLSRTHLVSLLHLLLKSRVHRQFVADRVLVASGLDDPTRQTLVVLSK